MRWRRLAPMLLSALVVIGATWALLGLLMIILTMAAPEQAAILGVGRDYLLHDLTGRAVAAEQLLGFKPLLDIPLFLGCYALISLLIWSQEQLGGYLINRRHFKS